MHVWGYWKCPSCGRVIRADNKTCPSCGTSVQADTKFFINQNEAIEYVPPEKESKRPNWICEYCNSQNPAEAYECRNCGAPKHEAKRDYFGEINQPQKEPNILHNNPAPQYYSNRSDHSSFRNDTQSDYSSPELTDDNIFASFFAMHGKTVAISAAVLLLITFLIWFFTPVTRVSTIQTFGWSRSIAVEEYKKCRESDWTLPAGAELAYVQDEIHHYDQVFDHYETRYRDVSHQEPDGYDVDYKDLGNGQFDEVKTPRYKTVWEKEPYTEAVNRDEPVYRPKYYYDIGRWKKVSAVNTNGANQEPYWGECDYPKTVPNPQYGDCRQGSRTEEYYAVIYDNDGKVQEVKYPQNEWLELQIGDEITYKTFRFSNKPL